MLEGDQLSVEEQMAMLREGIVALLYRSPHCWVANILGRRLADLMEEAN